MSSFGSHFRVTTYGESHCLSVGCVVDGCPPGLKLTNEDIQIQLSRRRPGQSNLTTPRDEADAVAIQSGTEFGVTLGTPIALRVQNKDQRPHDYSDMDLYPRPSHADWTYLLKYGVKASSGGGRSSARETIGRVAAGAIAEKFLKEAFGVDIVAFVSSVGQVELPRTVKQQRDVLGLAEPKRAADDEEEEDDGLTPEYLQLLHNVKREDVDANLVRCPDDATAQRMERRILTAKGKLDSIGGTVTCVIRNAPKGLGEPCFDKLEAKLAHAMMSLPATKGFEIGSGFAGTVVPGSRHNDMFVKNDTGDGLRTTTNHSGGVQGGITNGEDIYFRVAFKSVATISQAQQTAQYDGSAGTLAAKGRHDPCVLPRAVPIVETMAALTMMDAYMAQAARSTAASALPDFKGMIPPAMKPPPGLNGSS